MSLVGSVGGIEGRVEQLISFALVIWFHIRERRLDGALVPLRADDMLTMCMFDSDACSRIWRRIHH